METNSLPVHAVLDFVARHLAHRSLQTLADVADINAGNLRSSLGKKRSLPVEQMRRLAAACGLKLQIGDGTDMRLFVEADTILYLDVNLNELQQLTTVIRELSKCRPGWRFVSAKMDTQDSSAGVYMTAIAHVQAGRDSHSDRGYIAAHISDLLSSADLDRIRAQVTDRPYVSDESHKASDSHWIRLRSGMWSARELDALYKVGDEPEPTARDWAHVLITASEMQLGPGDIIMAMRRYQAHLRATGN